MWRRTGALESRLRRAPRRCDWDLDALTVAELEQLMPLAEQQAAAEEAGVALAWTPEELALLEALAAKAGALR